jgi:hypothetical protein
VTVLAPALKTELLAAGPAAPGIEHDFAPHRGHEEPTVSDGGGLTLGQLVDSVWEGLHAAGAAGCPACGGRMQRVAGVGRCGGCGAALA